MAILRLFILIFMLLGFFLVGAPLQYLALRQRWRLSQFMPVLLSKCLCWGLGLRVVSRGRAWNAGATLLVANHVSWTDILVLGTVQPLCFLAKHEVAGWPMFGLLARLQGTVFINRQRRRAIPTANAQMAARMQAGGTVVLFAEATTSDGTRVKRFHSSHFAAARDLMARHSAVAEVAVQPVAIAYVRRNGLALSRAGRAELAWYGDMTMLPHVWALLRDGPVDCQIIPTQRLAYARGADRKQIARLAQAAVRQAHAAALSGRVTDEIKDQIGAPAQVAILLQAESA